MKRFRPLYFCCLILIPLLVIPEVALHAQNRGMRGFPASRVEAQRAAEEKARTLASASRVEEFMRVMAAEPHNAGSDGSKKVADYILRNLRKWGWQAEFEIFEVMLPYPKRRRLEMLSPTHSVAAIAEPAIDQDLDSGDRNQLATFNAYGASADVTGPLIYVNYGTPEDYAALEKMGISVKGKIVIARYGKSWRGIKPKLAQERGALGCLIYSDPEDDGYGKGEAYPEGPYRPPQGVQRGSVMDMPIYPGDPTTPFEPSIPGAKRLKVEDAPTILKIPVLPISYNDARPLLEALGGTEAPGEWQGGLRFPYHIGDGNTAGDKSVRVRLQVENSFEIRKIYNVIATMPGTQFPDEWVIYGNHHDAWVNGANDPVSGASAVLETARVLGELRKSGWQPERSIKLCFWDGEEYGIIGSTEWVERHRAELQRKLVAYFNSDSNGRGQIRVGGTPHLAPFVREVLADVPDPSSGRSVLDAKLRTQNQMDGETQPFRVEAAGSGSDYAPFLHHITMPALNFGFGGGCPGSGVYHSIYDTIAWYEKYCDPGHVYGEALSEVMLTALMRLSSAPVLPYDFAELAESVRKYRQEVAKLALERGVSLDFGSLDRSTDALADEARQWNEWLGRHMPALLTDQSSVAAVNEHLITAETQLALAKGLPGRPWYRHPIYAPGLFTGYGVKTLPGVRESLEQDQAGLAKEHLALVSASLNRLSSHLRALRTEAESRRASAQGQSSGN